MSFWKNYPNRKDYRKPSRVMCSSCQPGGSCPWCIGNRTKQENMEKEKLEDLYKEWSNMPDADKDDILSPWNNYPECLVPFCRLHCQVLPEDAEVFRASGDVICDKCNLPLRDHEMFAYPTGMKHVYRGCDGKYYHL